MTNSYRYSTEFQAVVSLDQDGRERGRLQVPSEDLVALSSILRDAWFEQRLQDKDFCAIIQELQQQIN